MGLYIQVLKPIRKLEESTEASWDIYTLDFSPIDHLTVFEEGHYECEEITSPDFHWSYGIYNEFRRSVCEMALDVSIEKVWCNIENYTNSPFIEFINFADNEGCFDYVVAEKLYNDFFSFFDKAKIELDELCFQIYTSYMETLRIAAKNKAVICYY